MPASAGNGTVSASVTATEVVYAHNNNGSTVLMGVANESSVSGGAASLIRPSYAARPMAPIGTVWTAAGSGTGLAWGVFIAHYAPSGSNNVIAYGGNDNMISMAESVVSGGRGRSFAEAFGNSTTPSSTPASTHADDLVVDFGHVYVSGGSYTPGTNQTSFGSAVQSPGNFRIFGSWQDGANGAVMDATVTSAGWRVTGVSVMSGPGYIAPATFSTLASTETSAAACSPEFPAASVDSGDVLIAHVYFEGTATAPDTPSGWTLLSGPHVIQTTIARHWVYGKIADGSENSVAIEFGTQAVTTMRAARLYSFKGRSSGTITDCVVDFSATSHATVPQMPSVTTTAAGDLAVALLGTNDDNAFASATGETGGNWLLDFPEENAALTPGVVLGMQSAWPTSDPGSITGGTVSTLADPSGVIGFQIRHLTSAASALPPRSFLINQAVNRASTF